MASRDTKQIGKAPFALFAALLLASVVVATVAMQEASPQVEADVKVDADNVLRTFLTSTVDEARYTDMDGRTRVFQGWTVEALLVEDMEVRINTTEEANVTSLEKGLESRLSYILGEISGDHHYSLKVAFTYTSFKLSDIGLEGGARSSTAIPLRTIDGDIKLTLALTE